MDLGSLFEGSRRGVQLLAIPLIKETVLFSEGTSSPSIKRACSFKRDTCTWWAGSALAISGVTYAAVRSPLYPTIIELQTSSWWISWRSFKRQQDRVPTFAPAQLPWQLLLCQTPKPDTFLTVSTDFPEWSHHNSNCRNLSCVPTSAFMGTAELLDASHVTTFQG